MWAILDWMLGVAMMALRMGSCFNLNLGDDPQELGAIDGKKGNCFSVFSQEGTKGSNQDAAVVWEGFGSTKDTILCGVLDGHGPCGHLVARKVRDYLPSLFQAFCYFDNALGDDDDDASDVGRLLLRKSLLKAHEAMDRELRFGQTIDCLCSGTTAVTLVKTGREITTANLGDSRAVLGTRRRSNGDPKVVAIPLTTDHKPKLKREARRIKKHNGRVFALKEEPDVTRVWLPNMDAPGLAMSRSFGDHCLKQFGLISVPEISHRHLTECDEFVIVATDGIWDVLSNQEAVDVIASSPSRSSSARLLVEHALRAWRNKYGSAIIDDISVVCLYLD